MWFDRIFFGSLTLAATLLIFAFGVACGRGLERPEAEIVIKRFMDTETVKSFDGKLDTIVSATKAPPMPCCSEPVAVAPSPEPAPAAPPCDYCGERCPCLVCGCGIAAKPVPQQTKEPPPGAVPVVVLGQISVPSYQTPPPGCAWVLYSDRVWRLVCQPAPAAVAPRPAVVIGFRVGGKRR